MDKDGPTQQATSPAVRSWDQTWFPGGYKTTYFPSKSTRFHELRCIGPLPTKVRHSQERITKALERRSPVEHPSRCPSERSVTKIGIGTQTVWPSACAIIPHYEQTVQRNLERPSPLKSTLHQRKTEVSVLVSGKNPVCSIPTPMSGSLSSAPEHLFWENVRLSKEKEERFAILRNWCLHLCAIFV